MAGNPTGSKWYSTPAKKRRAKPSMFTLTDAERDALDELAKVHGVARSRVVGAAILALAANRSAARLIQESAERVHDR